MKFFSAIIRFFKNIDYAKLKPPTEIIALLSVLLLMSLAFLPGLEITPKNKMTVEKFEKQCEQAGYPVEDVSDQYHSEFFTQVVAASGDDYYIGYYTFEHRAYAKAYCTHYLSSLQKNTRSEEYTYTSDYNRFYTSTDEVVTFLYRNNETMIYIRGYPPHNVPLDTLIENLNI